MALSLLELSGIINLIRLKLEHLDQTQSLWLPILYLEEMEIVIATNSSCGQNVEFTRRGVCVWAGCECMCVGVCVEGVWVCEGGVHGGGGGR